MSKTSKIESIEASVGAENKKFKEDFRDQVFMSNSRFFRYKAYLYFQLLKLYTNHMHNSEFVNSKKALHCAVTLPIIITAGFVILKPISVFKNIWIFGSIFGSYANFLQSVRDDMIQWAKTETKLGFAIREYFKQIALIDPYFMSFKEYTGRCFYKFSNRNFELILSNF